MEIKDYLSNSVKLAAKFTMSSIGCAESNARYFTIKLDCYRL